VSLDRDKGVVFKCDLCGGDPECVKWCNREALVLQESAIASPARESMMLETAKLISQLP